MMGSLGGQEGRRWQSGGQQLGCSRLHDERGADKEPPLVLYCAQAPHGSSKKTEKEKRPF